MTTKIRINARKSAVNGGRILLKKPLIPVTIAATWGLAVAVAYLLVPDSLWFARPLLVLVFISPLLALAQMALYELHLGETVQMLELARNLTARNWAAVFIVQVIIAGVFAAVLALLLSPLLQFSVVALYVSAAIFSTSMESNAIGLAIAVSILMVPASVIVLGWLPAPLLIMRDNLGPVAALRQSWNTTYGSKRRLLIASLPVVLAIACAVLFSALSYGAEGLSSSAFSVVAVAALVIGGAILWPWSLSTCMAGYVDLEGQRRIEKNEAWFGAASVEAATE